MRGRLEGRNGLQGIENGAASLEGRMKGPDEPVTQMRFELETVEVLRM